MKNIFARDCHFGVALVIPRPQARNLAHRKIFFTLLFTLIVLLMFASCNDLSEMVDEYNENCAHAQIWTTDTGSSYKYDANLLIPEESYEVPYTGYVTILLSCVAPCDWALKYEDENGDWQDVPDPEVDPDDPDIEYYTYASRVFNSGKEEAFTESTLTGEKTYTGHYYNTGITIDPSNTGLPVGTYRLSVVVWIYNDFYEDSAEVIVTE